MNVRTRSRSLASNGSSPVVEFRNPAQQADDRLANEASDGTEVDDFPIECLPAVVRDVVTAVSAKFGTPHSLAAINALGVVSASIGHRLQIRTFHDESTTANLYLIAIADTATGKSRVAKAVITPFARIENDALENWKQNIKPEAQTRLAVATKRADHLHYKASREQDESKRASYEQEIHRLEREMDSCRQLLISPKYICQDVTEPKLALLIMQNDGKMFVYDPDGRSILANLLGKHDKNGETSESVLLKGFSGDQLRTDRIGRDEVFVNSPCVTLCIAVQPDKFQQVISSNAMHDSGFIYRNLFADTGAEPQPFNSDVDLRVPAEIQEAWETRIETLFKKYYHANGQGLEVQCLPAALKLFREYHSESIQAAKSGGSKYPLRSMEKAFRVALCLHAVEHSRDAIVYGLTEETARRAIEIVKWFDRQAVSLLNERIQTELQQDMDRVLKIAAKPEFSEGFTGNKVRQYTNWKPEKRARVLGELITSKKLSAREIKSRNGKQSTIYSLTNNRQR